MAINCQLYRCPTFHSSISLSGGLSLIDTDLIAEHMLVTLSEILFGLAIGITLGIITGQFEMSPAVKFFLKPVLIFSQVILSLRWHLC